MVLFVSNKMNEFYKSYARVLGPKWAIDQFCQNEFIFLTPGNEVGWEKKAAQERSRWMVQSWRQLF